MSPVIQFYEKTIWPDTQFAASLYEHMNKV